MSCVRGAQWLRRTCVVAQRLLWRGVARWRGGEAVRAAGEAARAGMFLASGRGMCVSRGRADHRRRTRPAECRTAASIMSVRDRVREPGRGVIEELGVRRRGARRVSPAEKELGVCRRGRRWRLHQARAVCQSMEVLGSGSCVGLAGRDALSGVCRRRRRILPSLRQSTRSQCLVSQDGQQCHGLEGDC